MEMLSQLLEIYKLVMIKNWRITRCEKIVYEEAYWMILEKPKTEKSNIFNYYGLKTFVLNMQS